MAKDKAHYAAYKKEWLDRTGKREIYRKRNKNRYAALSKEEKRKRFERGYLKRKEAIDKKDPRIKRVTWVAITQAKNGWHGEDFEVALYEQDQKCEICGTQFYKDNDANADHCHKTGKRRSLLCNQCNLKLGMFETNRELYEVKFPAYVERWRLEHSRLGTKGSVGWMGGDADTEEVAPN
jgi:hypothetical protein